MDERMKKRKRYMVRCTAMLLIPVVVLLIGCGNDAVDITCDEAETQEEAVSDLEKVEANYDTDLSPAEVYELFLNGELTVELEEEQVTIDKLFWNNDIEYCFGDIDGDGSEELNIRDDVVYYAIKAVDGMPQILFEGWWFYEPIVMDEVCGILEYYSKYDYEKIVFITISTDSSTESDGEFWWFDGNKNVRIDEEDRFRGWVGYDEIDMEQYVQYREEQIAKQTENELEWTDKRLKDFATWQEAYIDFINKPQSTIWTLENNSDYSLIYVDDDDIPELYIHTGIMATGAFIVSFYDGKVRAINRERGGIEYIEYGGLFYSGWGNAGFYPCNVYMLEKGEFSEIGTGWISENNDAEKGFLGYDYFWEGSLMTEEEYEDCLNKLIDTSKCIESGEHTKDEILEILEDWGGNGE